MQEAFGDSALWVLFRLMHSKTQKSPSLKGPHSFGRYPEVRQVGVANTIADCDHLLYFSTFDAHEREPRQAVPHIYEGMRQRQPFHVGESHALTNAEDVTGIHGMHNRAVPHRCDTALAVYFDRQSDRRGQQVGADVLQPLDPLPKRS
jgi:hypothetical protein